MTNPFANPAAPGGGSKAPRPRDMVGALVAYAPKTYTPAGAPGNTEGVGGSAPRDRVTADLFILELAGGAPIQFGGSPEYERDPKPHTHVAVGPARFSGVWVSNQNIVSALCPGGQPLVGQMILGRIVRSEVGNRPFNLVAVDGTPDMARAIELWARLSTPGSGTAWTEPQPLSGAAPAANSVSYAPPNVPTPQSVPTPAAPTAPPVDAYQQWLATQAAAAQAPTVPPPPPGWDAGAWFGLTHEQRAQVLGSVAPQTPAPAPASAGNPW